MLSLEPVLQELGWGLVVERGVATTPIIGYLDGEAAASSSSLITHHCLESFEDEWVDVEPTSS